MAVPKSLRATVRELDNHRCAYCQSPEILAVTPFEIDHIVPQKAGGKTELDNLCLASPECNRHKYARQTAVDPQTNHQIALFHPRQQAWADHFVWNEQHTHLIGLTPAGRATISALNMNRPRLIHLRQLWVKLGYVLSE
ncbi:MAG: HNH endonuclease [Anaerolineae bacterium]|nr:HNH endonuclease [Anaerolineae bacterium]